MKVGWTGIRTIHCLYKFTNDHSFGKIISCLILHQLRQSSFFKQLTQYIARLSKQTIFVRVLLTVLFYIFELWLIYLFENKIHE